MSYAVESLNAMTQALRDAQMPVPVPTSPAPEDVRYPPCAYTDDIPEACTQFVDALILAEAARDAAHVRACDVADAFINAVHLEAPDFPTYKATQQHIKAAAALAMCFAPMTLIKAYREALKRAFGALPVSQSPEALRKAASRAAAASDDAGEDTSRGVPDNKPVADWDAIGQFIAKYGVAAVLTEAAKILATEKATVDDAHTLMGVARHYG